MVHEIQLERLMSPFPYPTQSKHCPSLLEFLESWGAGKGADQCHTERQQASILTWFGCLPALLSILRICLGARAIRLHVCSWHSGPLLQERGLSLGSMGSEVAHLSCCLSY